MGWSLHRVWAAALAVGMLLQAELYARTPLEKLRSNVSSFSLSEDDALLFHTGNKRVVVLADNAGKIGAILVHCKSRDEKVFVDERAILDLIESNEEPKIIYSKDGYSALYLYEDTASEAADDTKSIVNENRLVAVYNITRAGNNSWLPSRWHDGGVSFRCYRGKLAAEITVDLTKEYVEYAEVRISTRFRNISPQDLLSFDSAPATRSKNKQRRTRAASLGGQVLASDPDDDFHLILFREVYLIGSTDRLKDAGRNGVDLEHYIFPGFDFPVREATLKTVLVPVSNPLAGRLNREPLKPRLTANQLDRLMGGGMNYDELHWWKMGNTRVCAIANEKGDVEGFIVLGDSSSVSAVERVFSSPNALVRVNMKDNQGALLLYPSRLKEEPLPGKRLETVLRGLLTRGGVCKSLWMENDLLHMELETRAKNMTLHVALDAGRSIVSRIYADANMPSQSAGEKEICRMFGLTGRELREEGERKSMENAVRGRLVYVSEDAHELVLTYGEKSRYYTAGNVSQVRDANLRSPRSYPNGTPWGAGTNATMPTEIFNPASPNYNKKPAKDVAKKPTPLSPEEARKAYIDYLRKL